MLQLLVVEDEQPMREGLLSMIDWESLGIRIYGHAENGLQALPMLESGGVDLLLTDIRMPVMDGLQLITEIQNRKWDIACVLLSGYTDFEYARRALRLGVVDYLIKPCSPRDIESAFQNVVKRVFEQRKRVDDFSGLQHELRKSLPIVKSQVLLDWLKLPKKAAESRKEQMNRLKMKISDRHLIVIAVRPDRKSTRALDGPSGDLQLIKWAAVNIIQETLEYALLQPVETLVDQSDVLVICNGTYEWSSEKLISGLHQVQSNLNEYLKMTVSVGVSDSKPDIDSLSEAYREAMESLHLRFYKGLGSIVFFRDMPDPSLPSSRHPDDADFIRAEQRIIDHLRAGLYAEALIEAEEWLDRFRENHSLSGNKITTQVHSFLSQLEHLTREPETAQLAWKNVFPAITDQIEHIETLEELSALACHAIRQLVEILHPHKTHRRKTMEAVDYIERHYNSPGLSLAGTAKVLFVSSTYLSTLFKQEMGINFLDYVHRYRIEKAKAMLQSGDAKIQTIAKETGYYDEAHFTKTFKKWTGMRPSQYKKETADDRLR